MLLYISIAYKSYSDEYRYSQNTRYTHYELEGYEIEGLVLKKCHLNTVTVSDLRNLRVVQY